MLLCCWSAERGLTFEVPVDKMDAQIMVIITEVCVCVCVCVCVFGDVP